MQKSQTLIVGTRWLFAAQLHWSLGGFVGFIERYYDFYKTVLDFYSLQIIGNVYFLHIASPTQSYGTVEMNFYFSFLFGHWLV